MGPTRPLNCCDWPTGIGEPAARSPWFRICSVDPIDEPWDGRRYLTTVQYADQSNLAARQSIYAFQRPKVDLWSWALGLADLKGSETVVDVGCGNGSYLAGLEERGHRGALVGVDLSVGMLAAAREAAPSAAIVNADASVLPLATASAQLVLAMHMLYHCPDRPAAIAELARVTAPDGVTLVVTNGTRHLAEMDALLGAAVKDITGTRPDRVGRGTARFPAEAAGAELGASFERADLHWADSALHLTAAEPVVTYARSMSAFLTMEGADTVEAVMERVSIRAAEAIGATGELYVTTSVGCFVCRP